MVYILISILMIGILIALHEFGHFAAAKLCGVKVNEFAIGMGPQIFHKQGKETEYSLRLFPIGGFCAMEGESEEESNDPRAFSNRPWPQRLVILLAGVFMNFLTGLLIILCLFSSNTHFYEPVISGFTDGSTAWEQGLREGDQVISVDGHRVLLVEDISFFLSRCTSPKVSLEVSRGGERISLDAFSPHVTASANGTLTAALGIYSTAVENSPGVLIKSSWYQALDYVRMVWYSLGDLLTGRVGMRDMSGIVGMVDMMGQMGEQGAQAAVEAEEPAILGALWNIMSFVSFISINLSVMNLLPIPALDGGQVFLMAINAVLLKIRGRKLDPKYQGWVSAAGFACLLALMLAVTVSDILKQFGM